MTIFKVVHDVELAKVSAVVVAAAESILLVDALLFWAVNFELVLVLGLALIDDGRTTPLFPVAFAIKLKFKFFWQASTSFM